MSKEKLDTHVIKPQVVLYVGEQEQRLISLADEQELDSKIEEIELFIANNDGVDKSEEVKDTLYGTAIDIWKDYAQHVKNVKFTFYLNRKQYNFITELLLKKIEYDVDTVFLGINLTNMLGQWKNVGAHANDTDVNSYEANGTEITYIYHLIAKFKPKGLDNSAYRFAEILTKIGEVSKVIKYYDTNAQNLTSAITKWVASFDGEIEEELVNGIEVNGQISTSDFK